MNRSKSECLLLSFEIDLGENSGTFFGIPIVENLKILGHFHGKNPCRKKKECIPFPYCLSINVSEPKLSSPVEADCKYKNGTYVWREQRPAQTQAPP